LCCGDEVPILSASGASEGFLRTSELPPFLDEFDFIEVIMVVPCPLKSPPAGTERDKMGGR